jgi:pSer/pThr/pTyr-binding forkhead associated (FHA) protein
MVRRGSPVRIRLRALMAVVYLVVRQGGSEAAHLIPGTLTLGRGYSADLSLADPEVSREHASVRVDGTTVVVEDLESSNGTLVNGIRIESPTRLEHGDVITLGTTEIEIRVETGEEAISSAPATPTEIRPPDER